MIFRFRMISGDEAVFLRDYELNADCNFLEFHNFIQSDLSFDTHQLASFFLADEQWSKGLELTLLDMENDAGFAAIPMDSVKLNELLKSKKERLLYVFDIFSDRCFFIELLEIIKPIPNVVYPRCTSSVGNPPEQLLLDIMPPIDDFDDDNYDEITNDIGIDDNFDEFDQFDEEYSN